MRVLINGQQGGLVNYNLGADETMILSFLDDAGAPLVITGDSASVEVYASSNRVTVLASKAISGGTPASGTGLIVLSDTEASWIDLIPGTTYTFRAKIIESGGDILLSRNGFSLNVI